MPRLLGLTLGTGIPQDPASSLGGLALPAQPAWIPSLTASAPCGFHSWCVPVVSNSVICQSLSLSGSCHSLTVWLHRR